MAVSVGDGACKSLRPAGGGEVPVHTKAVPPMVIGNVSGPEGGLALAATQPKASGGGPVRFTSAAGGPV